MAKINEYTESKIKSEAKIVEVLTVLGVSLHRNGSNLIGLCPFHDDRTMGSFSVSPVKNMCSCYSCGAVGLNPIDVVMRLEYKGESEKEAYPKALRYLAAMYHIPVDDEPVPKVEHKMPMIPPPPKRDKILWTLDLVKPFVPHLQKSPLVRYMRELPLMDVDAKRLEQSLTRYMTGAYPTGRYEGWTIWWLVDHLGYVRSGKLMKYKADGHRDKEANSTWVHTLLLKAGKYNQETHAPDLQCLFGQHLLDLFPEAVIRIVESEKTAVICSAFTDMEQVIWMATGGMQRLNDRMLQVLMNKGRYIELYPDYDGYPDWEKKVADNQQMRAYRDKGRLVVSETVKKLWRPDDGPKADIADIMIRIVNTPKPKEHSEEDKIYEMALAKLGMKEHEPLRQLIGSLKLKIEN